MPPTCTICPREDVTEINRLIVLGKPSLRNIAQQFNLADHTALQRHKDCIADLFTERKDAIRAGLLADVDEVKAEIIEVKSTFSDNPMVRVQLIGKMLDRIEKEAKLTGAFQKERENSDELSQIKSLIESEARRKNITTQQEIQNYLQVYGGIIKPEVEAKLVKLH